MKRVGVGLGVLFVVCAHAASCGSSPPQGFSGGGGKPDASTSSSSGGGTGSSSGDQGEDGSGGGSGSSGGSGSGGSGSSSGGSGSSSGGGSSSGSTSSGSGGSGGSGGSSGGQPCTNLECQVVACGGSTTTQLTGQVLDPAGHNPIYNVVVYVPNSQGGALDPITPGVGSASCSCDQLYSGQPLTAALTDTDGNFTLTGVPGGANIPLVVQIGKWRKEITVSSVTNCTSNSAGTITLPKNLSDGMYASLPSIAVSTGSADTLECLLTRVGVDEAMFTGASSATAGVHVYQGGGGQGGNSTVNPSSPSSPTSLWDSQNDLMQYDIVMLSCEGAPTYGVDATTASVMAPYVAAGGRVFAEHFGYAFFTDSSTTPGTPYPEYGSVADWFNVSDADGGITDEYSSAVLGAVQTTLPNGQAFPEGQALKTWLGNVGALLLGDLNIPVGRYNAITEPTSVGTPWVQTASGTSPASTQYLSWDMPFNPPVTDAGVPEYCGRVVYSDLHVSGAQPFDYAILKTVPQGCAAANKLSADEDAIEFILFDLSSCVTPIGFTPQPPGTR
jgi:hypothetical protein